MSDKLWPCQTAPQVPAVMLTVVQTAEWHQQGKLRTDSTIVWTSTPTVMNHSHDHPSRSELSAPAHFESALQQSMSAIISHNAHFSIFLFFFPNFTLQAASIYRNRAPALLQNIITQCMQQYKQLFISMKSSINILLKYSGPVARRLERCWSCAISPLLQLWL